MEVVVRQRRAQGWDDYRHLNQVDIEIGEAGQEMKERANRLELTPYLADELSELRP